MSAFLLLLKQIPLAGAECPASDDPHGQHDDQQDSTRTDGQNESCTRTDGHESLEYEACVEADAIESADTS